MKRIIAHFALAFALILAPVVSGLAEDLASGKIVGPVTKLPMPRYVSMKADKGNVRRGPSMTHKVDWVFNRQNMPLEIIAEYGHWRRVRDIDGAGGWIHYSLLSGVRTVIVLKDYTPFRETPAVGSQPIAYAEQGVVARLGTCLPLWCLIRSGRHKGWALKSEIWGVKETETRD